jgi:hypothetical protein
VVAELWRWRLLGSQTESLSAGVFFFLLAAKREQMHGQEEASASPLHDKEYKGVHVFISGRRGLWVTWVVAVLARQSLQPSAVSVLFCF